MRRLTIVIGLLLVAAVASASTLYVGNDTSSPVAVYTSGGTFVQFFGQDGATGTGIDAAGDIWTVAPSFGNNHVVEYTPSQVQINSFTATVNGNWIEDMSHGLGNTLWVSTYEGNVFAINDQTGAVMSTFSVADTSYTGIAFDSTNGLLYVSGGLSSDNIFVYTTSGTLLTTIPVSTICGGIGYDVSDNTLWCGDFGSVHHYSITGTLLGSFSTSSGAYHDGLETANLGSGGGTATPEPASLLLLGSGLLGFGGLARKRMKKA